MDEKTVELKIFIEETINQILDAVINVQNDRRDGNQGIINPTGNDNVAGTFFTPRVEKIKFDIAVAVTEKDGAAGGIGIVTGLLSAGVKGNVENQDSKTSRIQFEVPVLYPKQKCE